MYVTAAKASLVVIIVIAFLHAIQTEPIGDVVVASTTAGIIPGTNLAVPAEVVLIAAAVALMVITALVFRSYARHRAAIEKFLPEFINDDEDPDFTTLVPALNKAITYNRMIRARIVNTFPRTYMWWKYLGQPLNAQAVTAQKNIRGMMRTEHWATDAINFRQNLLPTLSTFRKLGGRVRTYLVRTTML